MNTEAIKAVYLFIAELLGYKRGTPEGKLQFGQMCYTNRRLPELDEESLSEVIWLERLYDELDQFLIHMLETNNPESFHWSVPIELDMSASMIGITGCLLGDKRMLEATNIIGTELNDPWHIDGLSRDHVKKACTPKLYGSSQTVQTLWTNNKKEYTLEDLALMNKEMRTGMFGTADMFKDFVIENCNPKETMKVHVWNDKFDVKCNKYRRVGEVPMKYDLYDTETGRIRRIVHMKTKAVADLETFRRFFQTLLIHGIDSQIADTVAGKCYTKYGFCLDIHDAFLISPVAAADVRKWVAEELNKIYAERKTILANYFRSIGISPAAAKEWETVMATVVPYEEDELNCRGYVLK